MGSDTHTRETPTLLRTKLRRPRLAADVITCSHLLERLNQGFQRRATLVSAPASCNKTTLASSWLLEIGDWGLDNAQSPQSPMTNNQSPIPPTLPMDYLTTILGTAATYQIQGEYAPLRGQSPRTLNWRNRSISDSALHS